MSRLLKNLLLYTLVILFGLPAQNLRAWAQEASVNSKQDKGSEYTGDGMVEVEPSPIIPNELTGNFQLIPYRSRRSTWGFTASIGYSTFEPISYEPEFSPEDGYESVYSSPETPLLELQFGVKYNMPLGSLVAELGVGTFKEKSDVGTTDSELSIMPIRLGLSFVLDTLFLEPYVAPYISGGAYTMMYKEKLEETSNNGFTQAAPYFAAGLQFQLDWIDTAAAREAYVDAGIESTFIYVEGRKFFASQHTNDPDFESNIHIDAGLRVEF